MKKTVYGQNIVTGLVLVAIAAAAFALAIPMPANAATFPKIISVILAILGGLLALTSAMKMKRGIAIEEETIDLRGMVRPLIFLAMMLLYVIGIQRIGFYVTTVLALVIYMYVMGIRQPKMLILTTVVVMVLVYLVFTMALKVRLPKGIWM